ncbi:peptidoglycan DD-metalloendopeptidase family protein [Virgibacillus sp. Bac330]|uniref:peptidoglycan DD-metalloendopeptidase family protein n=1 Tax=Virgibacillus sp. Bac330 TaxID=2419841 RepID=UPI001F091EAD|nr:peptidoglycan DD-metalloendopeptidase family protein [Virgibacillus sp. Bac330]
MKNFMKMAKTVITKKIGIALIGLLGVSGVLVIFLFFILLLVIFGVAGGSAEKNDSSGTGGMYSCSQTGEMNMEAWNAYFETNKSGAFKGHGDTIIELAKEKGIDPVLFGAIALHETAYGKSQAVVNKNNPGGLMNPNGSGLYRFSNLDEGLSAMANTLYNRIIVDGLVTIEKLGSVYAPIGADNDPNNLNVHWAPNTKRIAAKLGGLTMNCDPIEGVDVEFKGDKAWVVPYTKRITSKFGRRNCAGCSANHFGIDIAANGVRGKPIVAFASGTVTTSTSNGTLHHSTSGNMGSGAGWYVVIDHGDGLQTRYLHLDEKGIAKGTKVKAGDVIGKVGSTGASTAAHLHFEIIINGKKVDPLPFLKPFLTKNGKEG